VQDKIDYPLTPQQLSDLLVTAFEGGSNYWLGKAELVSAQTGNDLLWYGDVAFLEEEFEIDITTDDGDKYRLNKNTISRNKTPTWVATDLMSDNMDAETADAWLQNALFNDIIYG
jgi:hypothetical protein